MADTSDILKDPTAELNLALALAEDGQVRDALDCFLRLHRHKKAGGSLPQQERGEGTAVGELAWGVTAAAGLLERSGFTIMADLLRRRLAAVTGEG